MAKVLKTVKVTQGDKEVVYAEVQDGKPVYVDDANGSEVAIDAAASAETIANLNREARGHRTAKEQAEEKLKAFEGLDPEKAREALATVESLSSEQLLTAGKVDEIKAQVKKQVDDSYKGKIDQLETKVRDLSGTNEKLSGSLATEKVTNAFTNSKYIKDKLAVPPSVAKAVFGNNFKVEEDKLVAYDNNGTRLYSNASGGEPNFDEALEIIIGNYPDRDSLLKGKNNSGGGGDGGGGGGRQQQPGEKSISRKAFDSLDATQRMLKMREGFKVVDDE